MIYAMKGNLLEDTADVFVNTVNTVGVMGKGIALQFKQAFPDVFKQYAKDCKAGQVQIGKMHVVPVEGLINPKYIIHFPTKKHWSSPSKLSDIKTGLKDLVQVIQRLNVNSIAMPPLGCGNGGLDWSVVRPLIIEAFEPFSIDVHLYEPAGAPPLDQMIVRTRRPEMTMGRALLLGAMEQYAGLGYRMSLLEVQKIAYLLHEVGALPKMTFEKHLYGPYSEGLNHVLQRMESHFIRGYGDRTSGAEIYLFDEAVEEAKQFLDEHAEAKDYLHQVSDLMFGFETPYDLELLSTVDWILKENPDKVKDSDFVVESVQAWNPRKKRIFSSKDIEQVRDYLVNEMNMAS
ncbi:macro domain-containing protein [Lentibacillus halophilus]|uniref:Macro domain-containing protein n=1 Tax=Lentibacillus halophilus TaxID=295065 RepID=A0ABN0Z0S8_9BACI